MKANQVPAEVLLRGIDREEWGLGWEAIMNATEKDIDFPTQGRLFAYIKTYISRKLVLENQYLRRTRVKDENGKTMKDENGKPVIKREYLDRFYTVTEAMERNNIPEANEHGDSLYNDMIAGALFNGTLDEARCCSDVQYMEWYTDLSMLGIPDYFIELLLMGEVRKGDELTEEEQGYIELCKEQFAFLNVKRKKVRR